MDKKIPTSLIEYIETQIIPRYSAFDPAHKENHARTVITQAIKLLEQMPQGYATVREDLLYTAAACHDLGLSIDRSEHHLHSGRIIREELKLGTWFDKEEIETIAQAAEDHRASSKSAPRSIYGMLVAEADRVIEIETIIRRTIQFGFTHYPGLCSEEHIQRAISHLHEKYGRGGYLKLWIPWGENARQLAALQELIDDEYLLRSRVEHIYSHSMVADGFGERS